MKQGVKKPRTRTPAKKKRRKKLGAEDRLRAVLVAGVLIACAGVSSFTVMYFHSVKARNEASLAEASGAVSSQVPVQQDIHETVPVPVSEAPVQAIEVPAEKKEAPEPPREKVQLVRTAPAAPRPELRPNAAPPASSTPGSTVPASSAPAAEKKLIPAAAVSSRGVTERPPVQSRGTLAFVIDDAGYNLRDLEPFLKLNGPLTIAVLPGLSYSAEAARRIRAAGKEVFLHQPMEALGGQNPGPGAIRSGMGRDEIRSIVMQNLDEIGPVAGINNHEGSRVTMDEEAMETILALCRERGILFLDSRTTAETAAPRAAMRLGITIGERDVFIDNERDRKSMLGYINTGLAKAEQKGSAIMIGHVWSAELAPLLGELFPDLSARGYSFSSVSKVINRTGL